MQLIIDAHPVHVASGGRPIDAACETLVFLHGAAMDHTVWTLFRRYFARAGYNALGVDLPGHGRSAGAPLGSVEELAAWCERLLAALGVGEFAAAGHSLGALIALELAARNPGRVRRLALLGVSCPMPVGEVLLAAARDDPPRARDMIMIWGHAFAAQLGGNPVAGLHVVNLARRIMAGAAPTALFADLDACNRYAGGIETARRVACPVTLVLGAADRMTPAPAARVLEQALAHARTHILADCGHMMMSEQPERTHRCLVEALT